MNMFRKRYRFRCRSTSETEPSGGVDSPPKSKLEPVKTQPEGEATVLSVAPEAEQLPPPPAKGWFAVPEPEGEPESFAPEAEDAFAAAGAAPEPEPEFEPEPEA